MQHSHGWGFPEGGWSGDSESHYFVDQHALCDKYLGYAGASFIGESRPSHKFCTECLDVIATDARTMRSAATVTLRVDR